MFCAGKQSVFFIETQMKLATLSEDSAQCAQRNALGLTLIRLILFVLQSMQRATPILEVLTWGVERACEVTYPWKDDHWAGINCNQYTCENSNIFSVDGT